jgi:hypothetical protein
MVMALFDESSRHVTVRTEETTKNISHHSRPQTEIRTRDLPNTKEYS